ncbi:AraC family transcriptional regulator [Paenibacillus turpanensis]|uniref:AraC family transcriptional regulator n=1 Tax=Paenibacillus turpanensis TaxID=2689078 RepID=UPI001FB65DBC|nr:helix-turn-helix domain-containing protein [Paenibacillus turpanensis]
MQHPKPSMGVLQLHAAGKDKFQLRRYAPSERAAFFVKHYWVVRWDLSGEEPYMQQVIPNPCVNLVVQPMRTAFYGPAKQVFTYPLQGSGCVFGIKFKPGAFYPFIGQPISELGSGPLPVEAVLPVSAQELERLLLPLESDEEMAAIADGLLVKALPEPDDHILTLQAIIDRIAGDRDITQVDQLCDLFQLHKRKLQRLFEQYVGVSPKWVIRLYRLQNAAERIDLAVHADWLTLAAELGYHDQSHFIKDFKAFVGQTPEEYAAAFTRN